MDYISDDGTMADKPDFTVEPDGLITLKKEKETTKEESKQQ